MSPVVAFPKCRFRVECPERPPEERPTEELAPGGPLVDTTTVGRVTTARMALTRGPSAPSIGFATFAIEWVATVPGVRGGGLESAFPAGKVGVCIFPSV